ncbi:MAG: hypothetical protein FWE27_00355 [Defluviitaleaceae bacterium]|nr:hypothetical protein [Defluviitaleaceae bacterium]
MKEENKIIPVIIEANIAGKNILVLLDKIRNNETEIEYTVKKAPKLIPKDNKLVINDKPGFTPVIFPIKIVISETIKAKRTIGIGSLRRNVQYPKIQEKTIPTTIVLYVNICATFNNFTKTNKLNNIITENMII